MALQLTQEDLMTLAEKVIQNADGADDLPQDVEVMHMDFEVMEVSDLSRLEGRRGVFYRFSFVYSLEMLRSDSLMDEESEKSRVYRRQVRLSEEGKITGYSEREEVS